MTSTQWANIGEDAGALHALVQRVLEHAPLQLVDYLWIFPSRRIAAGESVVVVAALRDVEPGRRRVLTAHFTVSRDRRGSPTVNVSFDEHGSAPTDAVPRIVQGVLRRLGEEVGAEPREERIDGDPDRWNALIVDLGGSPPRQDEDEDEAQRTPEDPADADFVATDTVLENEDRGA
jgi:hypothetical protein